MKTTTPKRKKKPQDLTGVNNNARKKEIAGLRKRIELLEGQFKALNSFYENGEFYGEIYWRSKREPRR
jgi:hypothetical protein